MAELCGLELDLEDNNNKVNFYQFKHYPDNNVKSVDAKKVAAKENYVRRVSFVESSFARRRVIWYYLWV